MEISEKLIKQITETSYLTAENVARYRPILRFFYEEYETTNYMLYKEEVFSNLKDKIGFEKYNEPIYLTLYNLAYIKEIEENKYKKALNFVKKYEKI